MTAYYNEHDFKAAAWLRELIKAGHIAPGDVDERSIEDVLPIELAGYTQCHFFAGIGVWSHALRRAGWDDDRPVWTGSCPCQPFSAAGKRAGLTDERHLWPAFDYLIGQCRPDVVFGEQVASSDGLAWLDIVQSDMEAKGYAIGTLDLCAAGFGAPHIRQRLFFVADAADGRLPLRAGAESGRWQSRTATNGLGETRIVADAGSRASQWNTREIFRAEKGERGEDRTQYGYSFVGHCDGGETRIVGDSICPRPQGYGRPVNLDDQEGRQGAGRYSATAGFWSNAEWVYCRDGKYRATEPGTFPLAYRAAARMGRLRGYGNAIVAPVAEAFIRAYMEILA